MAAKSFHGRVGLDADRFQTVYDSTGFEKPKFTPGNLAGQGQWVRTNLPAPVVVQWDLYAKQASTSVYGPYFAVEAYDAIGNAPRLAGSAGIDASTGDVHYQAAGTGYVTSTGNTVSLNAWHHFDMVLDYATQFPSGDGAAGGDFHFAVNVLSGDTDGNGSVEFRDLLTVSKNYGRTASGTAQGDFDANGKVGFEDLLTLALNYGRSLPASPSSAAATAPRTASVAASLFATRPIVRPA